LRDLRFDEELLTRSHGRLILASLAA
jgi:hypothetical protein